jgi:Cyclin, N-terminal domain
LPDPSYFVLSKADIQVSRTLPFSYGYINQHIPWIELSKLCLRKQNVSGPANALHVVICGAHLSHLAPYTCVRTLCVNTTAMNQHRTHEMSLQAPLLCKATVAKSNNESASSNNNNNNDDANVLPTSWIFRMFVACNVLQVSPETRFTAIVLLYRYAHAVNEQRDDDDNTQSASLDHADWPWVGGACLFLACKTEEENRRLRDVINMIGMVLSDCNQPNEEGVQAKAGSAAKINLHVSAQPPLLNEEYWDAKKRVIETEQAVLRWLGFDCYVSHPHRAVLLLLRDHSINLDGNDDTLGNDIATKAFQRLNDALFSMKALQYGLLELACASIELAKEGLSDDDNSNARKDLVDQCLPPNWWNKYQVSADSLNDCKTALKEAAAVLRRAGNWQENGFNTVRTPQKLNVGISDER